MRVFMQRSPRITRYVQPAGTQTHPTWRDGICFRLPFGWSVIAVYRMPRLEKF